MYDLYWLFYHCINTQLLLKQSQNTKQYYIIKLSQLSLFATGNLLTDKSINELNKNMDKMIQYEKTINGLHHNIDYKIKNTKQIIGHTMQRNLNDINMKFKMFHDYVNKNFQKKLQ